jgi:hypothetical protein
VNSTRRLVAVICGTLLAFAAGSGAAADTAAGAETAEAKGVEVIPIYDFQFMGGQNFYTGQAPSLSANAGGVVAPAVKFNDEWSLVPTLTSNYTGTRQVLDLVAGGSLFRSQWDNAATIKALYTPDGSLWRIKPYGGFKYEFLRESTDEQLGKGLYDYRQWETGLDAEYVYRDPFSVHAGLDYYEIHFPNYTSLESQAATQFQGQDLARELIGDYVLDTQNVLFTAGGDGRLPFGGLIAQAQATLLGERFPNQHVVDGGGNLTGTLREDVVASLGAGVKRPWDLGDELKVVGSFDATYSDDDSNQSSYDASETRYIPLFYNYEELKLSPDVKVYLGPAKKPMALDVFGAWWHRRYPNRPIQDASGNYLGSALDTDSWMASASVSYPMDDHFNLLFTVQYGRETSNQQFLELYQYDYTTATYMFGFSYDY